MAESIIGYGWNHQEDSKVSRIVLTKIVPFQAYGPSSKEIKSLEWTMEEFGEACSRSHGRKLASMTP